jgi:histidine triad (HIT) family protein
MPGVEVIHHAPPGYVCFFCNIAAGRDDALTSEEEVVLRTRTITALVAPRWAPMNPGHVIIIPNEHFENIYEFPFDLGNDFMAATRQIALALKAGYGCEGVSTRQHNEPAGYQDAWHFHQHVSPRWTGDRLYQRLGEQAPAPVAERRSRARTLRHALAQLD